MPQSRIFQSPVVKWGVPVVVLSALVLLFFCGDPLKMSGPVDTAKNDSEPAVAARGPVVDEVVAGDSVADPDPLAANDPASDGSDELNGIGGLDTPSGVPVEFPATGRPTAGFCR